MSSKPSYLCIEHYLLLQDSCLLPQVSMYPLKAHILVRPMWPILCHWSTNELHVPHIYSHLYVVMPSLLSHCLIEEWFCLPGVLWIFWGRELCLYCIIPQRLLNPTWSESTLLAELLMDPLVLHLFPSAGTGKSHVRGNHCWEGVCLSLASWCPHSFLRITWEGQIFSLWLNENLPEVVRNSYKGH